MHKYRILICSIFALVCFSVTGVLFAVPSMLGIWNQHPCKMSCKIGNIDEVIPNGCSSSSCYGGACNQYIYAILSCSEIDPKVSGLTLFVCNKELDGVTKDLYFNHNPRTGACDYRLKISDFTNSNEASLRSYDTWIIVITFVSGTVSFIVGCIYTAFIIFYVIY